MLPLLIAGLLLPSTVSGEEPSLPPGERPVKVHAGFFLVNLSGVAERSETFDADLYLNFRWQDSRLAFDGTEPRRFLEDAAVGQLDRDVVAADRVRQHGRADDHQPRAGDLAGRLGAVRARDDVGVPRRPRSAGAFLSTARHSRCGSSRSCGPTTRWSSSPDPTRIGFNPDSTFEGLVVTRATAKIRRSQLAGWGTTFSGFVVQIDVGRQAAFYVWTVFVPVTLIFLISCTVFVVRIENFADRVGISLDGAPRLHRHPVRDQLQPPADLLPDRDRPGVPGDLLLRRLGVLISTLQAALLGHDHERAARVDRLAGLGLPALFLALFALCMLW